MITIVCGPPCAGKTTYVDQHALPSDIIIDFDIIARELGSPVDWQHSELYVTLARDEVAARIAALTPDVDAWIIRSDLDAATALAHQLGATLHLVQPGRRVCLERAASRPSGTRKAIGMWYWRSERA